MADFDYLYPLDTFYSRSRQSPPQVAVVEPAAMAEPYRTLLVHTGGMTSTLEAFHGARCGVRVLEEFAEGGVLSRQVVLVAKPDGKPVEFAAAAIHMDRLPAAAQADVRKGVEPLGAILRRHSVAHTSCPRAFLRFQNAAGIAGALGLQGEPELFGRRNTLFDEGNNPLVEIVEVLPPVAPES